MNAGEILQDLIRIDTQNPPGNEAAAVAYIEALCKRVGLDYDTYIYGEARGNIVVRVAPSCTERLVILGHLDVVPADEASWNHQPFGAEIEDGFLYGRGALDMKYFVAVALAVLIALKPREGQLKRGITCLFTADEENGSAFGLPRLLDEPKVREEVAGCTVLNEGGGFAYHHDGHTYSLVDTGQKSVARVRVRVPEIAGSSPYFPTLDHERILTRAIRAVEGVTLPRPIPKTARILLDHFASAAAADDVDQQVALLREGNDPFIGDFLYTMTHSLITATVVHGGARNPGLPGAVKAEANFDCRLLPGISRQTFARALEEAVAHLPVEATIESFSQGYESDFDNAIVARAQAAIRRADPAIEACLPFVSPGANDGKYLLGLGCTVLGFAPLATSQPFGEVLPLIHGIDERISLESLDFCTTVIGDLCRRYVEGEDEDV